MISSASKSVASVTTKVSQSLTTAIESINIPNPEEMAKIQVEDKKTKSDDSIEKELRPEDEASGFKLDSLLSNVSLISSKVMTGGLETLEGIGKKTMNMIQETDPNIKSKLRSINSSNRPNLSDILKEAKDSDTANESRDSEIKEPLVSFEHELLEEYSGLVYLEALEILSKQSKMKIELLMKPLTGKSLADMDETLKEVEELFELPDSDSVNDKITTTTLSDHLAKAIEDLSIALNFKEIISYSLELNKQFEEADDTERDCKQVYNNSIDALAKLCALSLNNYQKMAELMLSLSHRSTADEVDAVIQLTSIYFSLFNYVASKFSEKVANSKPCDDTKKLSLEVFMEVCPHLLF
jgi:hypothetical protein